VKHFGIVEVAAYLGQHLGNSRYSLIGLGRCGSCVVNASVSLGHPFVFATGTIFLSSAIQSLAQLLCVLELFAGQLLLVGDCCAGSGNTAHHGRKHNTCRHCEERASCQPQPQMALSSTYWLLSACLPFLSGNALIVAQNSSAINQL
jgi:hypothetical protein